MDPNDLDLFNRFLPTKGDALTDELPGMDTSESQGTNLADLILEKIAAHEATQSDQRIIQGTGEPEDAIELPAKVVEVYSK